jgi:hypothetical protein
MKVGASLFLFYPSLREALKKIYDDFEWQDTRFARHAPTPPKQWPTASHQRHFLDSIKERLGVKEVSMMLFVKTKGQAS